MISDDDYRPKLFLIVAIAAIAALTVFLPAGASLRAASPPNLGSALAAADRPPAKADLALPTAPITRHHHHHHSRPVTPVPAVAATVIPPVHHHHHHRAVTEPSGSPQQIAQQLLDARGWGDQFSCLDNINTRESGWQVNATNPSSGAYGIPQALPGSKMSVAGADWQNSAYVQLKWQLQYIHDTYGTPCGAWAFWQTHSYY